MTFPFGRDFTYSFYALVDDAFENISSVASAEAIYVYKDKPSRTQAADGTGTNKLETITTWENTEDLNGKCFTIGAIDDPDPTSAIDRVLYWLATNFKYNAAEQTQTLLRGLPMQRADAWHKVIGTTAADLESIFPDVDSYSSSAKQLVAIQLAKDTLEEQFEAAGFEWAMIWRPDRLDLACAYLAIASICLGLGPDEKWVQLSRDHRDTARGITDSIKLEYDRLHQGEPTTVEQQGTFVRIVA